MHWFIDPIKNHYSNFSGRTTRKEYWMFILIYFLVTIVLSIILKIVKLDILLILFQLALLIPSIAIATRRLHDTNKSGWWQLIGLIPLLGVVIIIVLLAQPRKEGANDYVTRAAETPSDDVQHQPTTPEAKEVVDEKDISKISENDGEVANEEADVQASKA